MIALMLPVAVLAQEQVVTPTWVWWLMPITVLGALYFLVCLYSFCKFFNRQVFRPCCGKKNFMREYGQPGTWALVTGGSDGIGLECCNQLANDGFNIIMVSRNQAKIDTKLEELRARYPDREFGSVAKDLGKLASVAEVAELFDGEHAGKDIGVVILNAGICPLGTIDLVDAKTLETIVGLNVAHVVYCAKYFVDRLKGRGQRSYMGIVSSLAAKASIPGLPCYSASK
mgnify:CR=1 FL=1